MLMLVVFLQKQKKEQGVKPAHTLMQLSGDVNSVGFFIVHFEQRLLVSVCWDDNGNNINDNEDDEDVERLTSK